MPVTRYKIFISSVQKELATERRAVKDFITHDPLLSRFVSDVFLFEDIPAGDRKPDDIYLGEVEQCDIYLAILGNKYGWKNEDGKSPTELEFEHATTDLSRSLSLQIALRCGIPANCLPGSLLTCCGSPMVRYRETR